MALLNPKPTERAAPELPVRKPIQAVAREDCYCTHSPEQHRGPAGINEKGGPCLHCQCQHYLRRPCVCGHLAGGHNGSCLVKGCDCKTFRQDGTPEFLLRSGVHYGQWQAITADQLKFLQRPDQPVKIRVWATGMIHAIGNRRRLAVKRDKAGNFVPLQPDDILTELNSLDEMPRAINVRREFRALEEMGAMRRVGSIRRNMRLFFYLKPLKSRTVKDEPEENLADRSVRQIPVTDTNNNYLEDALILPAKKSLVKLFLRVISEHHLEGVATEADISVRIEQALEPVAQLLKSVLEGLLQPPAGKGDSVNVSNGPTNEPDGSVRPREKTKTSSPGNDVLKGQSVSQSETDRPTDPHKKKKTTLPAKSTRLAQIQEIITRWVAGHLSEYPTPEFCQRINAALAGADLPQFVQSIQKKLHKIKSLGFLEHLARDCAATQDAWREAQTGQGSADEAEVEQKQVAELLADPKRMKLARRKEAAEHPLTKIERLALEQAK